jgi:hypothetical protein
MSQLGSVFDDLPAASEAEKGPDVRVRAAVRRSELEAGACVLVPVPDAVPHGEGTVPRRREPDDPPGAVRLHLSPRLTEGSTLRLRRQGGEHPTTGVPGDLHVEIAIGPEPEPEPRRGPLVVAVVLTAITAAAVWLSHGIWWG